MEIIIFVAVVVVAALLWSGYVKAKKTDSDRAIDNWTPPKEMSTPKTSWPFPGGEVGEGKIHVKVADVASLSQLKDAWIEATEPAEPTPAGSENRVETPAPVAEPAPAKKTAAKPAAAKKAPAKKKSV